MSVAVITDSAASLPAEVAREHGIGVVPLQLVVDGGSYHDGDLGLAELAPRLGDGVSTSNPPPGEFLEAYSSGLANHDELVVLTIAASMSSTHQAAVTAAGEAGAAVRVIDTGTAAGAQGLVALAAARVAGAGGTADEVAAEAERVMARVRLVATVGDLNHLVRSGRVPGLAGWAAEQMRINPLFEFSGGRVKRLRPALSRQGALDRIADTLRGDLRPGDALHVTALHALAGPEAEHLMRGISELTDPVTAFVGEFSPVMVSHTGPGLVGLGWWTDQATS